MGRKVTVAGDNVEARTNLMTGMLEGVINKGNSEDATPQDEYLAEALQAILSILAKYQSVTEADLGGSHPQEIEHDMTQLTSWSFPISIAGAKAKTAIKYLHGRGRKEGSQAFLSAQAAADAKQVRFTVATGDNLKNKVKGAYEMREAEAEMEAECLREVISHADSLCQVLKRVHDRQMREYTMLH